jgi:hypothetical protein
MPDFPRTVNVAEKTDLTQSWIVLGHIGIRADNPHYAGIQVANRILGSGFASRLFREVRSNRGYAYAVGSAPGTGYRFPGAFIAYCGTKSSTTEAATELVVAEIEKMTNALVTEEELKIAKDGILNSEVFNFDTKREILDRLVMYEMYGYPEDFLQKYMVAVREMTQEKILAATQAVWHPEKLAIFAVGQPDDWDGDLSKFGAVNMIDITIPEPDLSVSVPPATEESLREGQERMAKAAVALAGDQLANLKGFWEKMNLDAHIMGMDIKIQIDKTTLLPDRQHTMQAFMGNEIVSVVDGDRGWIKAPPMMGGNKDMSEEQLAEARREINTDQWVLFRDFAKYDCQALPSAKMEGRQCLPVYIKALGSEDNYLLLYLDSKTHLPYITQSPGQQPGTGAPVTQKVVVTEYTEIDGCQVASGFTILHDDEEFATGTVESFQLNPPVDEALFQK